MSISKCLNIVNTMDQEDQDNLLAKLDAYIAMGIPADKAQKMAASDVLAELTDERDEFMRLVQEQHPDEAPDDASAQIDSLPNSKHNSAASDSKQAKDSSYDNSEEAQSESGSGVTESLHQASEVKLSARNQTESTEFKAWFGNWQTAANAKIIQGEPISKLNSSDAPQGGFADVVVWVRRLFAQQGGVASRPGFGDVVLDGRSAKSSLAHGGANKYKKVAFAAAKDVIERGALIKESSDSEEDSFYFSAPVEIDGAINIETVLVHRDANTKRMYLHSVTTKENLLNQRVSSADAEAPKRSGSTSSGDVASVLQNLLTFKPEGVSKVVDAQGRPLVVYHGTNSDFQEFKLPSSEPTAGNPSASRRTSHMGIFFSSAPTASSFVESYTNEGYRDGGNVIPVYLSIANPKVISPREFSDRFVKNGASDDVKAFVARAKNEGHDGVMLKGDPKYAKQPGKSEYLDDTYIAFSPTQIKSAMGNNGNWDGSDSNISHSKRDLFGGFANKATTVETDIAINSKGDMKQGGNVDSDGRQITGTTQGLKNFWRWFGNSDAIDAKGKPLLLYHSTQGDIAEFEIGRETVNNYGLMGDMKTTRAGIFATPDKDSSEGFLRGDADAVMPVYMSLQKALDMRNPDGTFLHVMNRLGFTQEWRDSKNDWAMFDNNDDGSNPFVDKLKEYEYDGAIFMDSDENDNTFETYVAFEAPQVKSALGNIGAYSQTDGRISYSTRTMDDYLAVRNKGLSRVTPQSVLDADIDLATRAIEAAVVEIKSGNYRQLSVPIGPVPHVLRMLRAPTQMLKIDAGIIKKILIDKHANDFAEISPRDFVLGIYKPALVLKGSAGGEFELVSPLLTAEGPIMFVVKQDVDSGQAKVATVMSAYAKPVAGSGNTIAKRILSGSLIYADMGTAQTAITGNPQPPKDFTDRRAQFRETPSSVGASGSIVQGSLNEGKAGQLESTAGGLNSANLVQSRTSVETIADDKQTVKPVNANYAGWRVVKSAVVNGIADKKVKDDVSLMAWIGNNYKPAFSKGGRDDAPPFSARDLEDEKKGSFYDDLRKRLGSGGFGNYPGALLESALLGLERGGVHIRQGEVVFDTGRDGSAVFRWTDPATPFGEYVTTGYAVHSQDGDAGFHMPIIPSHYLSDNPSVKDVFKAAASGMAANTVEMRQRKGGAFDVALRGPTKGGRFHMEYRDSTIDTGKTNADGESYIQVPVGLSVAKSWMREAFRRYAMLNGGSLPDMVMARATGANPSSMETTKPGAEMEIRYSMRSGTSSWDMFAPSKFDDLVFKLQNKMIDTKRVIESITKYVGDVADDLNVYLQEELFHGRAAKRTSDFAQQELTPLMKEIKRAGYKLADVEEYLHARHAREANRVIANRNPNEPGLQDGGSGMDNATADAYMASLGAGDLAKLQSIAVKVDAILTDTRQLYATYGLESQQTVDAWSNMFQHYIPLQREEKEGGMGIGQGFSVKGKETRGRTGSKRKVVDILANIAMQRERLIVRGEKNRVAQALIGLAESAPNPDFWSVGRPPSTRVYDPKTNTVVERIDPMYKNRDNVVVGKVRDANGVPREVAVVLREDDPRAMRMAAALKNLDAGGLEGLLGVSAKITRYFAAINTQYNPVFGVVNLIRDVQGAMVNLGGTPLEKQKRRIAADTLSALKGIYADIRAERNGQPGTSPWSQLFEEFQKEGGQTGFRDMFRTSADRAAELEKTLDPDAWADTKIGKMFTAGGRLRTPMTKSVRGAAVVFDWLSDYNSAMENGVRLAAYKAGLDQGMSKQQAASLAKNLTVNFNRKGDIGMQAGAVWAFFNAAMQGSARIGTSLFDMEPGDYKTIRLSSIGKKVVYGGMMLGSMQAMALLAAGFGDDDPPEFLRERSLIIPTGGKSYISIPMPLGLHVIPGMGRHMTEFAMSGFEKPAQRAVSVLGMFADAFNPIGNAGFSMQTIAPTALDPFVALSENRDWTGKPIARTSSNKALPGHSQWKDSATAPAKWLAEAINWASGGNEYVAGALSPTPDQIEYLVAQATGGVGRELMKVEQTLTSLTTGEELPTYKVPLAGRFFGNTASQSSQAGVFYSNSDRLNALETEIKGMRKDGKVAEASALMKQHPEAAMIARVNVAERQIQRLRREKRELIKQGAERAKIKVKETQITEAMTRVNTAMERFKEAQQ